MPDTSTVTVNVPPLSSDTSSVTVNVEPANTGGGGIAPKAPAEDWLYGRGLSNDWLYGAGRNTNPAGLWLYGAGDGGDFIFGEGDEEADIVIPYASLPQITSGTQISEWVNARHGNDYNGDGAYDVGVVISNLLTANIQPASNDTVDYDEVRIFEQPRHGSVQILNQNGDRIEYMPSQGFVGIDTIGYSLYKDSIPVAMATVFVGVYGAEAPADTFPSYRDIPLQTVFVDQNNEISLSQFVDLGTVDFRHVVVTALDIDAEIEGSVLILTPDSNRHGLGVAKVVLRLESPDGSVVYETKTITIEKISDANRVKAEVTLLINGDVVETWVEEALSPEKIFREIKGSYGGIEHNNEPVRVEVK